MRRYFFSAVLATIAALLPSWAFGSDQETAQQIAESLRASGRLQDYAIGVKFEEGKAYLLGRVSSPQQMQTAVEMARQLPYVTEVESRLEIKATPKGDVAATGTVRSTATKRTINRDQAVFGGEVNQVSNDVLVDALPQPTAAPSLRPAPTAPRVTNNYYAARSGAPIPAQVANAGIAQRAAYDQPNMPCYSWPSYASYPNYAAVTYPNQYSAAAWPYIGPFYPYPQVPLGWRKVTMEWKDGWWFLDFNDHCKPRPRCGGW